MKLRSSVTEGIALLLEAVPLAPKKQDERWKIELSVRGREAPEEGRHAEGAGT